MKTLSVSQTPLSLKGPDELDVVKRGFLDVFPRLRRMSRDTGIPGKASRER
jgi:hypothetical protein